MDLRFVLNDLITNGVYGPIFSRSPLNIQNFILNKVMDEILSGNIKSWKCHPTLQRYYHLWLQDKRVRDNKDKDKGKGKGNLLRQSTIIVKGGTKLFGQSKKKKNFKKILKEKKEKK